MTRCVLMFLLGLSVLCGCSRDPLYTEDVNANVRDIVRPDGTRCVVTLARFSPIYKYPVAITCDWQCRGPVLTPTPGATP